MIKKILSVLASAVLVMGVFAGCANSDSSSESSSAAEKPADVEIANFTAPVKGEKIAVMTVKDFGTIKIKLFAELAPKGVENFEGLSDMGYYDELIFHRVIKNFMIQGGDPKGTGQGGNSMWGTQFKNETSDKLYHFTGAVAYANSGADTNGSQFYIVTSLSTALTDDDIASYNLPANVDEKYKELGGQPGLDGDYTIFGQVFEGQDVADKIAEVKTVDPNNSNDKPVDQVLIENVKIVEYEG